MKPGKIYQLSQHRLACGDSSDSALVNKLVGEEKVGMILVDPPYSVAVVESKRWLKQGSKHKVISNDGIMSDNAYQAFTEAWLGAVKPHLAHKNSLYIFNSDKMLLPTVQALRASGGKFAQLLIWAKTQAVVGRLDYLPQHELIIYGWFGTHKFHKSKDKSILVYPKPSTSKQHPTMKPVGLLRRIILNSTEVGDVVFDGFVGSGSTLLACEQTNRRCLAIELDPEYCQIVTERWEKLTGKKAEVLS